MANWLSNAFNPVVIGPRANAGSKTGFSLAGDSTFAGSDLTAGYAIAWRFVAPATTTVTDAVFYVHTAPAVGHDLTVLVCAAESGQVTRVGAYLTNGYKNIAGGTTSDKWVKATFATPPNITVGDLYWIVVCDENYDAGNVYQIMSRPTAAPTTVSDQTPINCFTSADGFTTNGTAVSNPAAIGIAFGNTSYLGQPYTLRSSSTSNQVYRGVKFTPSEDITLSGIVSLNVGSLATTGTIAIFQSGVGTVLAGFNGGAAFTIPTEVNSLNGTFRFGSVTLTGGVTYRIVMKPAANDTDPTFYDITDYASAQTILEGCGISSDGTYIWTYHDGGGDLSTNWTDETYRVPSFGLLVAAFPDAGAGAGGGSFAYVG